MTKEIYLLGNITEESCVQFSKELSDAVESGATKIRLKINSGGGSVISALSIYDEISALQIDTEAIILGMCASAATYPALACDKILMQRNASFMIHRARGSVTGTCEEMSADLDFFEEVENRFITIYAAKTGKSTDEIISMMDATTYMNAEQALSNGFVDEVIGRENALFNVADIEILDSIEVQDAPKNIIDKVVDLFKSNEAKEQQTLQNKLEATENKVIELTNELESVKIANEAAIAELNNIIETYKQKEIELNDMIAQKEAEFETRLANEVNTRLVNLGVDTELPDASDTIPTVSFENCKSIDDVWQKLGY